ncbi:hypothetical protein A2154_01580 [Candidatus Gottesmanbacteria bacterium RBG_16_43_7]|uniref:Glycosyltransferase 2-like domain-containing protein n=1 Tax=Candidatus Gottesmanbacteria bacterium RBG_16_43_7 TaxID=1798373 RepID=A0A1F5ZBS4_9BACT|nr:MAG: hypothetical protein A2154_01580 [Candidatus Gottesmanbacteria bacterium RBG_16_43_7]
MNESCDLSVVIVSYNTKQLLLVCLKSVFLSHITGMTFEVLVYDNRSSDGSASEVKREFPRATVIRGDQNIGYARANNIAIKKSHGRYILLLNSDTEVQTQTIQLMYDFMEENPQVAVSTCKLVLEDGRLDPACHRGFPYPWTALTYLVGLERLFPKSRLFGRYHLGYFNLEEDHEIDSPSGAFYLVRRDILFEAGLLDEQFFMYGEDLDLSYRIKQKGHLIMYHPRVIALHRKKRSGRFHADPIRKLETNIYFHQNNLLFFKKHLAAKSGVLLTKLVELCYWIRLLLLRSLKI